jgi:ABC-2 type transport system permease protein
VQRAVARVLGTLGAGVTMTTLQKLGEPTHQALDHAAPVALAEGFPFNPEASYAVYLAPAYVYFFLHVFALFIAWSVLAPVSGAAPVGRARLGAFGAVLAVTTALGLGLTYGLLQREGVTPASSPLVVTAALAAFLALDLLLAAALASAVPNQLLAFQVTVLLAMLSFVLSGLTWPADTFPAALRALSEIIPFTPFGRAFRAFLHEPTTLGELTPAWLAMAAQATLWTGVLLLGHVARRVGLPAWRHT